MDTWQDAASVLETFSSLSRISKGNTPLSSLSLKENTESPQNKPEKYSPISFKSEPTHKIESPTCFSKGHNKNIEMQCDKSPPPSGMGRGLLFKEFEQMSEGLREQLDMNIHQELNEISCGYSNEAIERNWGFDYSSSSQFGSASDDDIKEQRKTENVTAVLDEKQNDESSSLPLEECLAGLGIKDDEGEPSEVGKKDIVEEPPRTSGEPSEVGKGDTVEEPPCTSGEPSKRSPDKKKKRKCRNLVVLSLENKPTHDSLACPVLKHPDAFLVKPSNRSYCAALGSNMSTHLPSEKQNNSLFSLDDFPAL